MVTDTLRAARWGIVAPLLLLGGCSWFSWLPWVDKEEVDPLEPAKLVKIAKVEVRLRTAWRGSVGEGLGKKYLRLRPVVLADRVFAVDGYGTVVAFDRFKGKRQWAHKVDPLKRGFLSSLNFFDRSDPSFVGGIGSGGGNIYIGTTTGFLVALSAADGHEVWRADLRSEVLSSAVGEEGLVFLQTEDGRLVALNEETGEQVWVNNNQVPVLTLRGTASPSYAGGMVFTGAASGKVTAIRARNGEPVWEQRVMLPEGRSELERIVDVDGTPLAAGGNVYVAAFQGRVKALRQRDGSQLWEREASSNIDLAEGYNQIYLVDEEDTIFAYDQGTGEVVWKQEALHRRKLSPPVVVSSYLVVGDDEGYLHVLAQSDGRLIGRRKLGGKGIRSGMVDADGLLYVYTNSGKLSAIAIEAR
ncbi:MAG: outer membrane protein assembly factor BamB [Pseudomonadales bacterium]